MPEEYATTIQKKSQMKRNLVILLIKSFFSFPAFWIVNISAYAVEAKGIPEELFFTFFGIYSIFVFLLEIPTGVISDKVSRKMSVLLGYLLSGLAFLIFTQTNSYLSVFLLFFLLGIGVSLISGAVESILYDSLAELGHKDRYKRYNSFMGFFSLVTAALYTLSGGYLIEQFGSVSTMYATSICFLIAFVLTVFLTEPPISEKARKLNSDGYMKHTWNSMKIAFGTKAVKNGMLLLMVIYSFVFSVQTGLKYVIPSIVADYGGTQLDTSQLSSVSLFAIGISAMVFVGVFKGKIATKLIVASIALFVAPLIWAISGTMSLALLIILTMSLAAPIITTIIDQRMNDDIETKVRSSILSLRNMVARGVAGTLLPIFGWSRGFWGVEYAVGIIAVWMFIAFIGILIYWKTKGLDKFK
jgi:MFS family permease